jgi:pimeloyl-ACP methyl ester carboxylesterase
MSTYVLVHGAFTGEWCWEKIVPLLQNSGHRVVTFDLPGHGKDQTPPSKVTLKDYTDRVCSVLDNESEKVILIGHSFGGIVITQVAEYRPEKIQLLVYLTAIIPENEQTLIQLAEKYKLPSLPIIMSEDKTYLQLDASVIEDMFYNECSEKDALEAQEKFCPQPLFPYITPVHITDDNFGIVPRVYIETLKDKALSIDVQRKMYTKTPCQQVITMNTDHSPFFSQPEVLVSHLEKLF